MRVLETLIVVLVVTVVFMWVILAHTTPEEQARLHDSMGRARTSRGDIGCAGS
jgi:hypothetical protein